LKVSANIKIAVQCFENFGGGNAPTLDCAPDVQKFFNWRLQYIIHV